MDILIDNEEECFDDEQLEEWLVELEQEGERHFKRNLFENGYSEGSQDSIHQAVLKYEKLQ